MTRTWTRIGEAHSQDQHAQLGAILDGLTWRAIPPGGAEVAAMPGLAMRAAIRELRLPQVSHYAISHDLAPYGLYGLRAHYQDGTANVYLVDDGSQTVVVASDFYPRENT